LIGCQIPADIFEIIGGVNICEPRTLVAIDADTILAGIVSSDRFPLIVQDAIKYNIRNISTKLELEPI
jgi:hypothetical protein